MSGYLEVEMLYSPHEYFTQFNSYVSVGGSHDNGLRSLDQRSHYLLIRQTVPDKSVADNNYTYSTSYTQRLIKLKICMYIGTYVHTYVVTISLGLW